MSIVPKYIHNKHCFIPCPPDRCDCKNGNLIAWEMQEQKISRITDKLERALQVNKIEQIDKDSY